MAAKMESNENYADNLTLHEMFRVVGDQMTARDIRVLKLLYTGLICEDTRSQITSGYDFFLALEKIGRVDSSNFRYILHVLRVITRHDLIQYVTLRRRKTVEMDPVEQFLERTAPASIRMASWCYPGGRSPKLSLATGSQTTASETSCFDSSRASSTGASCVVGPSQPAWSTRNRQCTSTQSKTVSGRRKRCRSKEDVLPSEEGKDEIKKKVTCDIRLRVRAEYCHHDNALEGNIFSNKPAVLERQFERFSQANTILKSRDLGSIICDIKFSELTYLDAFWRDYINGSLLEALKGVFITESLKQAVGHEAIKLLVSVDEDDYEAGRLKLLQNLQD